MRFQAKAATRARSSRGEENDTLAADRFSSDEADAALVRKKVGADV